MGSTRLSMCDADPRPEPPASPQLFWRFTSHSPPIDPAIRSDDEARAIHWITFYASYASCAPHETLGCPLSHPTLGYPQPHLPEALTGINAQEVYKAQYGQFSVLAIVCCRLAQSASGEPHLS